MWRPVLARIVGTNKAPVGPGNAFIVGGQTPRVTAQMTRPGQATQYAVSDLIGNSQTAASVVPIEFVVPSYSGRISGARGVVTCASGTIVLPDMDLLLFRPATDIPFAAGSYPADNAALAITAAAHRELVGVLNFAASGWRNKDGIVTTTPAGTTIWQEASFAVRPHAPYNVESTGLKKLLGILCAKNTWNPGNVAQTIDIALDVDAD